MTNEIAKGGENEIMQEVLMAGDLAKMEPQARVNYYLKTCESLGMNPMTKPFDLITLNGKMVLYPNRSGTDQLRKIGNVSLKIIDKRKENDVYIVLAQATTPSGRTDESTGVVSIGNLKGDALANALMKAETKAKRRVTLSIMGLGWIDESEVHSIKGAELHKMDLETGDVIDVPRPESHNSAQPKQSNPVLVPQPQVPNGNAATGTPTAFSAEWKEEAQKLKNMQISLKIGDSDFKTIVEELFKMESAATLGETIRHLSIDQLKQLGVFLVSKIASEMQDAWSPTTGPVEHDDPRIVK